MSSYTTLSMIPDPGSLMPGDDRVRAVLAGHIDFEDSFASGAAESDFDVDEHGLEAWCNTRWSVDGLQQGAEALSAAFPHALVEWREQWDTGDADEPGEQGERYRGGRLVATGESRFVWTEEEP